MPWCDGDRFGGRARRRSELAASAAAGLALAGLLALPALAPRPVEARAVPLESELPTPPGTHNARAVAVNDSGVIAGRALWATPQDFAANRAGVEHAVVWNPAAAGGWVAHELAGLRGTTDPDRVSMAYGLNNAGQVVGFAVDRDDPSNPHPHAVVWSPDRHGGYGAPVDLSAALVNTAALNHESAALAINNSGQIVGCVGDWKIQLGFGECRDDYHDTPDVGADTSGAPAQPVLWTPTATGYAARYLRLSASPDMPADPSQVLWRGRATGINDSGQVIGEIDVPIPDANVDVRGNPLGGPVLVQLSRRAAVWSPTPLPDSSLEVPAPMSPSPSPLPASPGPGASVSASAPWLPVLLPAPTVGAFSQALGINKAGQIVGSAGGHAALWSPSATPVGTSYTLTQLPDAAGASVARAISDRGLIVGSELQGGHDIRSVTSFPLTWERSAPGGGYEAVNSSVDRGGPYGQANGVNSLGLIAGDVHTRASFSNEDNLDYTATLWYPSALPGPPVIEGAIPDDGQVLVFFVAPQSDGGSPILHYTVTASPGGRTATGPETALTVVGLTDGTPYTFTVTATNAVGTGPPSLASAPVTPMGQLGGDIPPLTPTDWLTLGVPPIPPAPTLVTRTSAAPTASASAPSAAPALAVAPPPTATLARAPLVGTFTGGHPARRAGGAPGGGIGHGSDDRFLRLLTAAVAGAAGLASGAWFGWQRGWAAATRRRLAGWRPRRRAEATPW